MWIGKPNGIPMRTKEMDFLISALSQHNPHMKTDDFMDWLLERQHAHRFHIEKIPFNRMDHWFFEPATGNLVHDSGKFFAIEGIRVETNFGPVPVWSQPIINQPEVGILGILAKKFDGILHFLMQAKMEPGNLNMVPIGADVAGNTQQLHGGSSRKSSALPGIFLPIDLLQKYLWTHCNPSRERAFCGNGIGIL